MQIGRTPPPRRFAVFFNSLPHWFLYRECDWYLTTRIFSTTSSVRLEIRDFAKSRKLAASRTAQFHIRPGTSCRLGIPRTTLCALELGIAFHAPDTSSFVARYFAEKIHRSKR
ncbi:MAG: hypothetical protein JWN70_2719 [Planctomycetaceae bacterium]|nr:hypothetical protein [Planctomycetaceae bacterium]